MERICTKCGNPIEDGDLFCDICGAKYEGDEALEEPAEAPAESEAVEEAAEPAQKPEKTVISDRSDFVKKHKEKLTFAAIALAVMIALIAIVSVMTANTPEAKLKAAVGYRLAGNVGASASIDYECNFSAAESKNDVLTRMKGNSDLTTKRNTPVSIKIISENRIINDSASGSTALTDRVGTMSANFKDTDKITDIRDFTYDLVDGDTVLMTGVAQAIKVNGNWYIYGVAQSALTF